MGDPVYLLAFYAVVPAIQGHRAECYGHCSVPDLTSTGPHRPGYHMGPTSGGSIGSQGMGDPVYLLAFYAVVDGGMTSTRLHVA